MWIFWFLYLFHLFEKCFITLLFIAELINIISKYKHQIFSSTDTSWLRDITPQYSNTTLIISYTTAQCIDLDQLKVQLTLNTGLTSAMSYAVDSNRMFILNSI